MLRCLCLGQLEQAALDERQAVVTPIELFTDEHRRRTKGTALDGLLPMGAMVLVTNHRPGTVATLGVVGAGGAQTIKVVVTGAGP